MSTSHEVFSNRPARTGIVQAAGVLGAGWLLLAASGASRAAVDTPEGPPPCGSDGICNLAVCSQDPDCPPACPRRTRRKATRILRSTRSSTAAAPRRRTFGRSPGTFRRLTGALQRARSGATDKNLGNCIENRFAKNGKVRCMSKYDCNDKGCKLGFASGLSQTMKIYQTFFDNIAAMPQPDRRACYAGLMTHEFSHSCERYSDGANGAAELREDAAFNYWKNRFAVTSTLDPNLNCGFD